MPLERINEQLWKLHTDTLERMREELAEQAIEIAVIKTKIALVALIAGSVGGILATVIGGAILYWLKLKT